MSLGLLRALDHRTAITLRLCVQTTQGQGSGTPGSKSEAVRPDPAMQGGPSIAPMYIEPPATLDHILFSCPADPPPQGQPAIRTSKIYRFARDVREVKAVDFTSQTYLRIAGFRENLERNGNLHRWPWYYLLSDRQYTSA